MVVNVIIKIKEHLMELYDVIIIGGGPAGMSASLYASRGGLKVAMLDFMPGGKLNITSEIENYPGHGRVSGQSLAADMLESALAFGTEHIYAMVEEIKPGTSVHEVITTDKTVYRTKAVIIASGTVERKMGVPGESEYYGMGVSYCAVCDAAFFRNKPVIVIGGGSTAFEDALYLSKFASDVKIVMRRDVSRAEQVIQERVHNNPKIERLHFWVAEEFRGNGMNLTSVVLKHVETGEVKELQTAAVFPLIGVDANTAFLSNLGITASDGFIRTNRKMETQIPGIYAAGDVRVKTLRQIVTATNDGAIAAESVNHYLDNWVAADLEDLVSRS